MSLDEAATQNVSIDPYDLVILHGLPASGEIRGKVWMQKCLDAGKSVVLILTADSDLPLINSVQSILQVNAAGDQSNEVQALLNRNFNDFQIPQGLNEAFRTYPPLLTPFAEYEAGPQAEVIAWQRLGDINTGYPLITTGRQEGSRIMIISGEGLWRWRMSEYARTENTEVFDAFINQLVQYVAVKEDKRKFRLIVNKNLFWENEAVRFNAELYNANYQLINDADVSLSVTSDDGIDYEFTMDKTLNAYSLDAGLFPVGNYAAVGATVWSGEKFNASVKFTVREVLLESMSRQANHKVLYNLSAASGGQTVFPAQMSSIQEDIRSNVNLKPILYNSEKATSLLQFQWIFFLLLALLSCEWFVRKWLGGF
jgi:hypothetical protein